MKPPGPGTASLLDRLSTRVLPTSCQTLLLETCLRDPVRAKASFMTWIEECPGGVERLARGSDEARSLGPMLWAALRRDPTGLPRSIQTYLRAAADRERERTRVFAALFDRLFAAMDAAGVPVLVLKGAALAWSAYAEPWHRHCHDLDLLVAPGRLPDALVAVRKAGFVSANPGAPRPEAVHSSGLPLVLHPAPHVAPHYNRGHNVLWETAVPIRVAGRRVRGLAPHENLLHVLVHAAAGSRRNGLLWATDARQLLDAHPEPDWKAFVNRTTESGAAVVVYPLLDFLATKLEAPVPPSILEELGSVPSTSLDRATAVLRICRTTGFVPCLAACGNPVRAVVLAAWLAFPSPRTLRAAGEAATPKELIAAYPRRILRGLFRHWKGWRGIVR